MLTSKRRRGMGLMAAAALTAVAGCSGGGSGGGGGEDDFTTNLQLGTGSTGGVYFPMGQEYSTLFVDNIEAEGLNVTAVETGASVENLAKIARGELQLGIAQHNTAQDAVNGEGEFNGATVENVGFLGKLYPEAAQVITLESSGIDSVSDLRGKTVAIGPPGGGTRDAAEQILSAYGLEEGDYTALEEGFGDAKAKLQDGNADASIEILGVPAASLQELQATTGEVKLVPLDGTELDTIVGQSQFEPYEIPADTYDFLDEPVPTVSVFAAMYASTNQVSEELGYELTKTLYEQADSLTLAQKELISVEEATVGQGDVPLHPGARKYFQEQGLLD
ncbi:TAXI family TRAP transporter solute-binding subunit [Saccharomonospora piscinae]|uniref:TAXI family TRAP transporter solute-binding subunit n=1 Tax=Saccharomonospora piscinae TaxID=687388 RepID=UPI0004663DE6|nr:TAXI family TRAP transporter solute-binding subunit [Saccharomonospora piscinae]